MKPSPEIADRLIAFIKGGAEPETAAEVCGISPETFDLWKSDLDFLKRLDTALAEARYARSRSLPPLPAASFLVLVPGARHNSRAVALH